MQKLAKVAKSSNVMLMYGISYHRGHLCRVKTELKWENNNTLKHININVNKSKYEFILRCQYYILVTDYDQL